jgi:hypothetical protein
VRFLFTVLSLLPVRRWTMPWDQGHPLDAGSTVNVDPRMGPGYNPGGPARVLAVEEASGTYSVKYIMGGCEKDIEQAHVHSSNLLGFTASRHDSAVQGNIDHKRTQETHDEQEQPAAAAEPPRLKKPKPPSRQATPEQQKPPKVKVKSPAVDGAPSPLPWKPPLEKRRWRHAVRCTSREPRPYAKPPVAMPGGGGMRQGRHVWLLRRGVAFDTAWHRAEVVKWYGRRVRDTEHMYQVRFLSDGMKRLYDLAPWQRAFGDDEGCCTWGFPEDDSCYVRPAAETQEDDDDDDDDEEDEDEESDEGGGGWRSSGETLDWVQCSACSKWRTLRAGLSDNAWGGTDFTCAMNSWHPHLASCDALEEEVDIDGAVECGMRATGARDSMDWQPEIGSWVRVRWNKGTPIAELSYVGKVVSVGAAATRGKRKRGTPVFACQLRFHPDTCDQIDKERQWPYNLEVKELGVEWEHAEEPQPAKGAAPAAAAAASASAAAAAAAPVSM